MTEEGRHMGLGEVTEPYAYSPKGRKFWTFHTDYPEVYTELVRRTRLMRARGLSFGIRTLWETMRWDFQTAGPEPKPYKLDNNYTPFYADLIMAREPDLAGFFQTRGR